MESKITQLAEKQRQLQEEGKKQSSFLGEIENAIKKLRNDRKITQSNLSKIEGALQAYADSALMIRDEAKQASEAPNQQE